MQKSKILIVDDELYHLETIIEIIEAEDTYRILQAFGGKLALKIAEKEIPDLIITDWEMPEMDGIELIRLLKKGASTMDIPVIMCTGIMTSSENLKTALDAGATDYIRKPIDKIELIARMRANINSGNNIKENKKLLKAKDEIFSIISHDLRGPIGSARTFLDMVINNIDDYDKDMLIKSLKLLSEQETATFNTLENLFTWSNSQRGNVKFTPKKQLLSVAINNNVVLLNTIAIKKNITIINRVPDNIEAFYDTMLISTTIRNLIANAIKFTEENGKITLSVEEKPDYLLVSVADTGVGMDECVKAKILNKSIYITTYGTNGEKGSGLGLKVCQDFIKKNGGELFINSQPNKGSTFSFTLPKHNNNN